MSSDECDAIIELAEEKGLKEPSAVFRNLKLPEQPDHSAFDKWDWDLDGSLSSDEVFNLFTITSTSIFLVILLRFCLSFFSTYVSDDSSWLLWLHFSFQVSSIDEIKHLLFTKDDFVQM